jgi:hypothetical protein
MRIVPFYGPSIRRAASKTDVPFLKGQFHATANTNR